MNEDHEDYPAGFDDSSNPDGGVPAKRKFYDRAFLTANSVPVEPGNCVRRIVVDLEPGDSMQILASTKGKRLYGPQSVETLFYADGGEEQNCYPLGETPSAATAAEDNERKCLDRSKEGHTCQGPVSGRESNAGTGTIIWRCALGHGASYEFAQQVRKRYPDSPVAPDWFDPADAGERWDEED